jgi:acylphosphatase
MFHSSILYFLTFQTRDPPTVREQRITNKTQVEGEAQGDEKALQELMAHLEKGPTHATVEKVDKVEKGVVEGEEGFEVRS